MRLHHRFQLCQQLLTLAVSIHRLLPFGSHSLAVGGSLV
ncbi:hypothetical protein JCM19237_892 [Photobacterium aphoticum]|uniref:Uncharacterized protein n=1 Tax=Photobacterium aphoticum TaxID=754436 RepID=A0A090R0L7_9GAMM|nr:hypothetical protein JCM19237_892 [Photobacterium aphoticum]